MSLQTIKEAKAIALVCALVTLISEGKIPKTPTWGEGVSVHDSMTCSLGAAKTTNFPT